MNRIIIRVTTFIYIAIIKYYCLAKQKKPLQLIKYKYLLVEFDQFQLSNNS
jgi:hypothetical protein